MPTEGSPNGKDPIELVAHETAVLIRRAESARRKAQTLDRSAYLLLDAIAEHNPLALGALAERFQLDISTVSRQVAMLETGGLVARYADPGDGRVCLLAITGAGEAQLQATRAARLTLFGELLADWSLEDRLALGAALLRLNQAIARRDANRRGRRERAHGPEDTLTN